LNTYTKVARERKLRVLEGGMGRAPPTKYPKERGPGRCLVRVK